MSFEKGTGWTMFSSRRRGGLGTCWLTNKGMRSSTTRSRGAQGDREGPNTSSDSNSVESRAHGDNKLQYHTVTTQGRKERGRSEKK
ncbi:hypothetical protein CDL15_Pgr019376 [Punica granatum]|uniref:Uncharacterized protein n=1 Tax=Punica granatum TaxID=22663 RepID=A0A218XS62_PUNGR|nr:hypothetical protein CDL15_Pgr019376 [Punica granatum]